jgi:hypothetical protein
MSSIRPESIADLIDEGEAVSLEYFLVGRGWFPVEPNQQFSILHSAFCIQKGESPLIFYIKNA